jgi:hypothetical protein
MESVLISPATFKLFGFFPLAILSLAIPVAGGAAFAYIMARRAAPLVRSLPDPRFDQIPERLARVVRLWLGQWRHPRYMSAGVMHIFLFAGFLILSVQSTTMVIAGISEGYRLPGLGGF